MDATPVNTAVSIERWKALGEACQMLKDMEEELRSEGGVNRMMLADKVKKYGH